jgi:hypothetical protein
MCGIGRICGTGRMCGTGSLCGTGFPAGLWVFRVFRLCRVLFSLFSSAPIRGRDWGREGASIHGFRPDCHRDSTRGHPP